MISDSDNRYRNHGPHYSFVRNHKSNMDVYGKTQITLFDIVKRANNDNIKCFQVYFGGNSCYRRSTLTGDEISQSKKYCDKYGITIYVHSTNCSNMANEEDPEKFENTKVSLLKDLSSIQKIPASSVLHFGSKGSCSTLAERLNECNIPCSNNKNPFLLLENSAGGNRLGGSWKDIRKTFETLDHVSNRIGLLLDTCHSFDAGMVSFRNHQSSVKMFEKVKDITGSYPNIHLNGSKFDFGSHRDRHSALCLQNYPIYNEDGTLKGMFSDHIWSTRNIDSVMCKINKSVITQNWQYLNKYLFEKCENIESLECIVQYSKEYNIDLICETRAYYTDNSIISCLYDCLDL